jgi:hypothetical protein
MSLAALERRLAAIAAKLAINRNVGQWVRGLDGTIIWDPWDMDAVPESDPLPRLRERLETMAERLRSQPGCEPPTEAQKAKTQRGLDEALARIRAERQAVRDFSDMIERERAGKVA